MAALGVAVALAILSGCGSGADKPVASPGTSPAAPVDSTMTFVLSGDTAGFIVPCGCTTKQFGGLPRRATYLKEARQKFPDYFCYVDAGGSVLNATAYDDVKLEFILKGVKAMRPSALNLGAGEMDIPAQRLEAIASIEQPAFLSTNVHFPAAQHSWITRSSIIQFVNSDASIRNVVFLGVNLNAKKSASLEVDDPHAALQRIIPDVAKEFAPEAIVLRACGDEHAAQKLAAGFPELTAVLVAGCGQSFAPRTENGIITAGVAQKGKFLARVTLTGHRNNWKLSSGEIVELSGSFADDPAQIENLNAYKQRLKELKLDPKDTGEVPALLKNLPADYRYAGSESCAKCHVQDAALHSQSRHAKGLETLRARDFAFDPYCLKCHTTGYGGPGGFVNAEATPQLGGIGCENCHGPGQAHAANPHVKTLVTDSKTACANCHDPENSPKFEFASFWEKIKHGQEKVK